MANQRGRWATMLFCVFGLLGWYFASDRVAALPQILMYAMLMWQTWFSLPLFFRLIDQGIPGQQAIDLFIGCGYAFLAYAIPNQGLFAFAWTVFFTLTVLKYALLVGRFSQPVLLRRKLTANVLGIALGWSMPIFVGFGGIGRWAGVILFGGACLYYFFINPLYMMDKV
jgi:hypothetical protein